MQVRYSNKINSNTYMSLKLKKEVPLTKGKYMLDYLNKCMARVKRENFLEFILNYINYPNRTSYKYTVKIKLIIDFIVQNIRNLIKLILIDKPQFLFILISPRIFLEYEIFIFEATVMILGIILNINKCVFYIIDNTLAFASTLKSAIGGSSFYYTKSCLEIIKIKSDKFDFLYFDKSIDIKDRFMYESWIEEILAEFNVLEKFKFNVCIVNENSNVMNESRRIIGVYDIPFQKIYENNEFLLGLYNPANYTVICKNISKSHLENLRKESMKYNVNEDFLYFSKNVTQFKKYQLYHEIAHLITISLNSNLLKEEQYFEIFKEERDLLYLNEGDYFKSNLKEYFAESLSRYLLEDRIGDKSVKIDCKKTRTYKIISNYVSELNNI